MNLKLTSELISLLALLVSVGGFLWTIFGAFGDLKARVITLETKMDLFWQGVQAKMGTVIKQPIHFRKDDLIDRFPNLSNDEIDELKQILTEEMVELQAKKDSKVIAYAIYLGGIENEIYKRKTPPKRSFLKRLFC